MAYRGRGVPTRGGIPPYQPPRPHQPSFGPPVAQYRVHQNTMQEHVPFFQEEVVAAVTPLLNDMLRLLRNDIRAIVQEEQKEFEQRVNQRVQDVQDTIGRQNLQIAEATKINFIRIRKDISKSQETAADMGKTIQGIEHNFGEVYEKFMDPVSDERGAIRHEIGVSPIKLPRSEVPLVSESLSGMTLVDSHPSISSRNPITPTKKTTVSEGTSPMFTTPLVPACWKKAGNESLTSPAENEDDATPSPSDTFFGPHINPANSDTYTYPPPAPAPETPRVKSHALRTPSTSRSPSLPFHKQSSTHRSPFRPVEAPQVEVGSPLNQILDEPGSDENRVQPLRSQLPTPDPSVDPEGSSADTEERVEIDATIEMSAARPGATAEPEGPFEPPAMDYQMATPSSPRTNLFQSPDRTLNDESFMICDEDMVTAELMGSPDPGSHSRTASPAADKGEERSTSPMDYDDVVPSSRTPSPSFTQIEEQQLDSAATSPPRERSRTLSPSPLPSPPPLVSKRKSSPRRLDTTTVPPVDELFSIPSPDVEGPEERLAGPLPKMEEDEDNPLQEDADFGSLPLQDEIEPEPEPDFLQDEIEPEAQPLQYEAEVGLEGRQDESELEPEPLDDTRRTPRSPPSSSRSIKIKIPPKDPPPPAPPGPESLSPMSPLSSPSDDIESDDSDIIFVAKAPPKPRTSEQNGQKSAVGTPLGLDPGVSPLASSQAGRSSGKGATRVKRKSASVDPYAGSASASGGKVEGPPIKKVKQEKKAKTKTTGKGKPAVVKVKKEKDGAGKKTKKSGTAAVAKVAESASQPRAAKDPVQPEWPPLDEAKVNNVDCHDCVGCDSCERWYHYACINSPGKSDPRFQSGELFICPMCEWAEKTGSSLPALSKLEVDKPCNRPTCPISSYFPERIVARENMAEGNGITYYYLVKWAGWDYSGCTWQPYAEMAQNLRDLIPAFHIDAMNESAADMPGANIMLKAAMDAGRVFQKTQLQQP